jgi:excinuclease ABC subunit A
MSEKIVIRGAREHNLKNINLELPKNKLIVFTGVSGSGKSSLAFDTLYAEGQRRYVESLSAYARQFLGIMDKPDVDSIEGLSPAISIDQKGVSHNPRSTVGTITEIYDYLRLLFARIGHPHCPVCGLEISQQSPQQILDQIIQLIKLSLQSNKIEKFMILSPVVRNRKGEFNQLFQNLKKRGYQRVRIDNQIFSLSEGLFLIKTNKHNIEVVIDRISFAKNQFKEKNFFSEIKTRIMDDIEQALKLSDGFLILSKVKDSSFEFPEKPQKMEDYLFSQKFVCPKCNISLPEIEPRTFSFNSPYGACPTCSGIGSLLKIDEELIINPRLSINEGGILPFAKMFFHDTWFSRIVKTVCSKYQIPLDQPLGTLSLEKKKILLHGTGEEIHRVEGKNRYGKLTSIYETFSGIIPELEKRYAETESNFIKAEIEKYMKQEICPTCHGAKLKKESLGITIDGKSIFDVSSLSIDKVSLWINTLEEKEILSQREKQIASPIIKEIKERLSFLKSVGLEYLTLDRSASTLSGGEGQRIRLASQIGSGLSGVLYVLDEPSVGLHQRDNQKLINTLKKLRDLGNTIIVVEHDREMMENADFIVDFGPGAGEHGGEIVAQGNIEEIKRNQKSLTGKYLKGEKEIKILPINSSSSKTDNRWLKIKGCSQFNLKNIDVSFPLGKLICITGVSGSGKSTLLNETLYHALMQKINPYHRQKPGKFESLEGAEYIDKVILIDQSPIGRTPRSNPATYTGVFSYIRNIFAMLPEAKIRGYNPGRFSFNVRGGRCETCKGEGQIKIEMQFLPDVYINCEICKGKRYNSETLEVLYKGKNIAEILEMTVEEAMDFFKNTPGLFEKLKTLYDVGLGYIHLGQPAPTLSGGEAQRVKIAAELGKKATGKTLYILDEPTTGLHFADLEKLLYVLRRLVEMGNTVIIIEHNLDVIKNADWIIDLGPEGGEKGGYLVACGTPSQVAQIKSSYTGKFLKKIL